MFVFDEKQKSRRIYHSEVSPVLKNHFKFLNQNIIALK